ncbi:MAG: helix-hairpin-helix domain-containing protein [Bacteroidia bacterium]
MKTTILRVVLFCTALSGFCRLEAQVDTGEDIFSSESYLNSIEDMAENLEADDEVDFAQLTDVLLDLAKKPLDINTATREQLLLLPGMNDLIINKLFAYKERFGALVSIYELQAVPGLTVDQIRPWLPFIVVKKIGEKDISPGTLHSSGPGFQTVIHNLSYELTQRTGFLLEKQNGFLSGINGEKPVYQGSPARIYTRFRARYGRNFSLALTTEKDPGEKLRWLPQYRFYGMDFISGHAAISGYGKLKSLVIGDYHLSLGQGLVLSQGMGFGKGSTVVGNVKLPGKGILPSSSANETQLLRGSAATFAWNQWYFTGFYSRISLDATVVSSDSVSGLMVSSIRTGGLHRTDAELNSRKVLKETLGGCRLEYRIRGLRTGFTVLHQQFNGILSKTPNSYNRFDFTGDHNLLISGDADFVFRNFNFFGEWARSSSGGMAGVAGLMGSLASSVDISLVFRHFDKDFHSDKGYAFAERPTAIQNETGAYLGLQILPASRWTLNFYFDQFYFPYNRFQADYFSHGWEFLSHLQYKPSRNTFVYVRFRSENKQQNAGEYPPGQQVRFLVPVSKTQLRVHFQTKINRDIIYRTRLEMSWFAEADSPARQGLLLYQDISWKIGYNWKISGRYAIFDTEGYDTRVYAYENDVPGFSSIPPYYQTGSRFYLIADWRPQKRIDLGIRVARTRLWQISGIGSGNDAIGGPQKTEVKIQIRLKM